MKAEYYPSVAIKIATLDMGTHHDYMDERSQLDTIQISTAAQQNRPAQP